MCELKLLFLCIIAFAVLPLASALTISDVATVYAGEEITAISPNNPIMVYLEFTLSSEIPIQSLEIDYDQLNDEQTLAPATINPATCGIVNEGRLCYVGPILLQTANTTPMIRFSGRNADGEEENANASLSFTIDDTRPEVTSIVTGACVEGTCYYGSGADNRIYITLQDSVGSFARGRISYTVNGDRERVFGCEEGECWGKADAECVDASTVTIAMANPSTDDAGNSVTGMMQAEAICDAQAPEIIEQYDFTASSGLPVVSLELERPALPNTDTIILKFNITESTSPSIIPYVDLSSLGLEEPVFEGSCELVSEDVWTCEVNFEPAINGNLANVELILGVTDFAGNKGEKSIFVDIMQPLDSEPDYWSFSSVTDNLRANKRFLEFTPKKLFVTLSLTPKGGSQTILQAELEQCIPYDDMGSPGDLQDPKIVAINNGELRMTYMLNMGTQYEGLSRVKYNCSVKLITKRGNYFSTSFEQELFDVTIDFHETQTIGEMIQDEVNTTIKEQEEKREKLHEIQDGLKILTKACDVIALTKGTGGAMNTVASGLMTNPLTEGAGKALDKVGTKAQEAGEKIAGGVGSTVCEVMSCQQKYQTYVVDKIGEIPYVEDVSQSLGYEDYAETVDPYQSQIVAWMMLCPPAILYHEELYQQVECEYAACLSRDVASGYATIEDCQKIRNYGTCLIKYGGIFSAVPFASAIKGAMQSILDIASDPVTFFTTAGSLISCKLAGLGGNNLPGAICKASKGLEGAIQDYKKIERIYTQWGDMFNHVEAQSSCDQVRQNIDSTSTYWAPPDIESPFDFDQERSFDGSSRNLDCNEYTGCTTTFNDGDDVRHVTFLPTGDGEAEVFIDGVRIDPEDMESGNLYDMSNGWQTDDVVDENGNPITSNPEPEIIPPFANVDSLSGLLEDDRARLLETLESGIAESSEYLNEMIAAAHEAEGEGGADYGDFFRSYMEYNQALADYAVTYPGLQQAYRDAETNYQTMRDFDDALRDYGQAREDFREFGNDRWEEYQDMDADDPRREAFEHAFGCNGGCNEDNFNEQSMRAAAARLSGDDNNRGDIPNIQEIEDNIDDLEDLNSDLSHAQRTFDDVREYEDGLPDGDDTPRVTKDLNLDDIDSKDAADRVIDDKEDDYDAAQENAKEDRDLAKHERDREDEKLEDSLAEMEFNNMLADDYGTWGRTLGTTLRFGRAMNNVSPMISDFLGIEFDAWRDDIEGLLGDGFVKDFVTGDWAGMYCDSKLEEGENNLNVVQTQSITFRNAAHVEGVRIREGFGEEMNYTYLVNAYVVNHDRDEELKFDIKLKNSNEEKSIIGPESLGKGAEFTIDINSVFTYVSDKRYDTICIHFHNSNLEDWFDVSDGQNEFCRRIQIG